MVKARVPRRLRKWAKASRKNKVKFCPWCGTAWKDRRFCNDYCKRRHDEL